MGRAGTSNRRTNHVRGLLTGIVGLGIVVAAVASTYASGSAP
jgi:hypothetical protein